MLIIFKDLFVLVTGPSNIPAAASKKSITLLCFSDERDETSKILLEQDLQNTNPLLSALPLHPKYKLNFVTFAHYTTIL
jgi:hypothetical protein